MALRFKAQDIRNEREQNKQMDEVFRMRREYELETFNTERYERYRRK